MRKSDAGGDVPASTPRHPLFWPVTGIFVLLSVQGLIYAADFLIPVTMAILGYFLLNAPRRALEAVGIPAPVSATLFALTLAAAVFLGTLALYEPMYNFVADIPVLVEKAAAAVSGPGGVLEPLSEAQKATEEALADKDRAPAMQVEVVDDGPGLAGSVAAIAPQMLSQLVFAICLLFFLVASGDLFIQKAVQVADRFQDKRQTVLTIRMIEARLGNYLGAITLINIGLGLAIGTAMWLWGLPTPWLIGLMATTLNFVPFVGAVVGACIAATMGFVTFGDVWPALGIFATYFALTSFEGQFVTPTLVGQRLRLNVVMVFLAVAFFAWIWSVMGMVVAVPMLIVIKVVCDSIPAARKIGLFLGDAEGFVPKVRPDAQT
ncbi:AI-2E family transporter [Jannaschia sp. M317]|uniref:AI-2E family transporter n=1 Tax=Jannaschia sp. M317 TaxID=2867011 RepID=UPI0021A81497|nr:AI-2E family transporter [Jannaschia sp. M317]UWQ19306.1 AI-2E family transporter [Jannaschia sp. M317]